MVETSKTEAAVTIPLWHYSVGEGAGAFTAWLADDGIRGGTNYGATDEFGWKAVVNPTSSYDFHTTALHLLGINHEQLTFYHNGIERRLTDVHGHLINELTI